MKKILPIIKLATQLATVERALGYRAGHLENDAEHSYQLALCCWSANEQYDLGLDNELIFKIAIAHDLVEVYAGDTDAMGDPKEIALKEKKEEEAFTRLKEEYREFKDLLNTIERYESKQDEEAKLVYVVDKLIPDVNVYNGKGTYYKDKKLTCEDWKKWFFGKVDYEGLSPKLQSFVDESIHIIETEFITNFYEA